MKVIFNVKATHFKPHLKTWLTGEGLLERGDKRFFPLPLFHWNKNCV